MSLESDLYKTYSSTHVFADQEKATEANALAPRAGYIMEFISNFFPLDKNAKILDIGCGYGAILFFAKKLGYSNLVGYDLSEEQVRLAQSFGLSNEVFHGNALEELKRQKDNSLDIIISFDLIEHFSLEEIYRLGKIVKAKLRQNGSWLIHAPNGESPFANKVFSGDLTHKTLLTQNSAHQLLLNCGFQSISCYEDLPPKGSLKNRIRRFLWLVIRNLLSIYMIIETGTSKGSIFSQNFVIKAAL